MSNLAYCLKFLDLHEKKDRARLIAMFKDVGIHIDPATTPWCAAFANYIQKLQKKPGTGKLNARSFLNYGKPVKVPKPGDIVVFTRGNNSWQGHVAYFVQWIDAKTLQVIGGNQGDSVCYMNYPEHRVLGYRNTDNV